MILKILIIISAFTFVIIPQDQQNNPNVELPDFVITGKGEVSLKKEKKKDPEIISTVSKDFLKPAFSPEELAIKDISDPGIGNLRLLDSVKYNNGKLGLAAGRYTLPAVDFSLAHIFSSGLVDVYALGKNSLEHVDNSGKYYLNTGVNFFYNLDTQSPFLPGTQFKLHGDYATSSYKFYASQVLPVLKRTSHKGFFSFEMNSLLNEKIIFGLKANDEIISLEDEGFTENLLNLGAFARLNLASFYLGFLVDYQRQYLNVSGNYTFNTVNDNRNFIALRPTIGLNISQTLKAIFGINYSKSGDNNFISPYASLAVKLDKNLSLFGEFAPQAEFVTLGNLLKQNPFFNPGNQVNVYLKKTNVLKGAVKYEFDKYFQIDGGFDYFTANNLPYFKDSDSSGRFDFKTAEVTSYGLFLNLLFHSGPYGVFYGTVKLNDTKIDSSNAFVPYHPGITASLKYGYDFTEKFGAEAGLRYASKTYTDIENKNSLDPYIDLSLKFAYKIVPGFTLSLLFNNIFSDNIFYWKGYKETPLDIIGGVEYRW